MQNAPVNHEIFLNQARAGRCGRREIDPVRIVGMRVRVCVCVCVRARGY